jgi:hypothetical protein
MNTHVRNQPASFLVARDIPTLALSSALAQLHYDRGEERLMLAVLRDAVECIERYRYQYGARSRSAYHEALGWVQGGDDTWLFSFDNVCLSLNLDASRLRSVLAPRPSSDD